MHLDHTERTRLLDPALRWVNDKTIGPEWNRGLHLAAEVVWLVHSGQAWITTLNGTFRAGPGDWVFIRPVRRGQRFAPGTRIWSIGYRSLRALSGCWRAGSDVIILRSCPALHRRTERLLAAQRAAVGSDAAATTSLATVPMTLTGWLRLLAAFHAWLACLVTTLSRHGVPITRRRSTDARLDAALARLEEDPWGATSSPAALARHAGLSRRRLEQLCATQLGHGLAEERSHWRLAKAMAVLANRQCERLAKAMAVLANPKLSIKEVARRCGFRGATQFSTWFRRHAGRSPTQQRRGLSDAG